MKHLPRTPIRHRVMALLGGPLYLTAISVEVGRMTDRSWWACLPWMSAGAVVIMIVLIAFGVRVHLYRESRFRFGLATLFLVTIPLCVYLAGIRWVLSHVAGSSSPLTGWDMFFATIVAATFCAFSTLVLLLFTETLVWCVARLVQWRVRLRKQAIEAAKSPTSN